MALVAVRTAHRPRRPPGPLPKLLGTEGACLQEQEAQSSWALVDARQQSEKCPKIQGMFVCCCLLFVVVVLSCNTI